MNKDEMISVVDSKIEFQNKIRHVENNVPDKELVTLSKEVIVEKVVTSESKNISKKIVTEKGLVEVIDTIIPEKLETTTEINQDIEKEKLAEEINAKSKVEQQKYTTAQDVKQIVVKKKVPAKPKSVVYKVKKGDCLGVIADRHNVTITQLKRWNNRLSENLQIGQSITIQK